MGVKEESRLPSTWFQDQSLLSAAEKSLHLFTEETRRYNLQRYIATVTCCSACCYPAGEESSNTYMTLLMNSLCSSGTWAGPLDDDGEI